MTKKLIGALALFALGIAACSDGETADIEVLSIEPIIVGDIVIDADPSGTTASLSVDTSIPVACSVIYGTDDSFGLIAVDSDMQGGAHNDHGPLMTGLEPDTEYKYIVQGSDANGSIYRSEVMSFRTPVAAEGAGTNIAPEGTISGASSSFSDGFDASLAIDGNLGTEWSSGGDGDDAWIEVDLGDSRDVIGFTFRTREMSDGTAITETFTVTVDGTTLGPFPAGQESATLDAPVSGRTFRFDADQTTGGNTGAVEVEILAAP